MAIRKLLGYNDGETARRDATARYLNPSTSAQGRLSASRPTTNRTRLDTWTLRLRSGQALGIQPYNSD